MSSKLVSYYSKVSILKDGRVRYSYHIKRHMDSNYERNVSNIIFEKTGVRFTYYNSPAATFKDANFSLDQFGNNLSSVLVWSINDPKTKEAFISALKMLQPILASFDFVDSVDINTKDIWASIVKNRNARPILVSGDKVYEMQLVEKVSDRPVAPSKEFLEEVNQQIDNIKTSYDITLQQEIQNMQQKMDSYVVPIEDFLKGFSSFVGDLPSYGNSKTKCLAKRINYCPTHIIFSSVDIRKIKPEHREKMRGIFNLVYFNNHGGVATWKDDGTMYATPHSFHDDGHMCTGSYHVPVKVSYEEAKEVLNHVEEMLNVINLTSLAGGEIVYNGETRRLYHLPVGIEELCEPKKNKQVEDGLIL